MPTPRLPSGASAVPAPWPLALGAALLAAASGAWVFRGALRYGFAQDDFFGLARATGLSPRLSQPWRWLSAQGSFDALLPLLGPRGNAWHGVVLAAHALVIALLAWLLARRLRASAALCGAAFVATHAASFHSLYWFSAHSDVMATLFGLVALALASRADPARWLALPVFAAALLEKEIVLLLPLVVLALPGAMTLRERVRDRLTLAMAGLSAVYLAYFVVAVIPRRFGSPDATLGTGAYAFAPGAIGTTLLTYAGWAANTFLATVTSFTDGRDPGALPWGVAMLALLAAGAIVPDVAARGGRLALVAFLAMLAPVLPLSAHTYHYYLYAALPALALALAAWTDAALARLDARLGAALALAFAAFCAWNGGALVTRIENMPFLAPELRADPIIDRARIAANVIDDLAAAHLPAGTKVRMWSPQSQAMARERGEDPSRPSYFETNVDVAVVGGTGVRATLPGFGRIAFLRAFNPTDSAERWAVYRYDGHLRVLTAAELARIVENAPR